MMNSPHNSAFKNHTFKKKIFPKIAKAILSFLVLFVYFAHSSVNGDVESFPFGK